MELLLILYIEDIETSFIDTCFIDKKSERI